MAKKKKTKRPAKPAAKKSAKKTVASKPKSKPISKSTAKKTSSRGTSVDMLLKKFDKERKTQESKLAASLKKIDELEDKAAKLRDQVAKLKEQAKTTQNEIDQLDSRRDTEVAEVLAKLGVQLSTGRTAPEPRPVLTLGQRTTESDDDSDSEDDD